MSNYTTFFPSATGGGSTEITDPDKIPKVTSGATGLTQYITALGYTIDSDGYQERSIDDIRNPYFNIGGSFGYYESGIGGKVLQNANNTEITLANVTNGSGYLCCIITPTGALGTTQEIKITVDGGTEKVYTVDYSSNTDISSYYTRLIWGFTVWGSNELQNKGSSDHAVGIFGLGGAARSWGDSSYPPLVQTNAGASVLRLFTAQEFKNYNLPKLRFESSILVKCKTTTLYQTTGGYNPYGRAIYYLDSQN
jgi:hypothetical protein